MVMAPGGFFGERVETRREKEEKLLAAKNEVLRVFEEAAGEPGIDGMDAAVINTVAPVVAKAVEQALKKVL